MPVTLAIRILKPDYRKEYFMKLDDTLGYLLNRTARRVHYRIDDFFKAHGLTVEQWVALKTISENAPLCQKELALHIDKSQNTVKPLLDRLMAKGLISRCPDERDKRNMILSITEKGKRKIEILSPLEEEINRTMEETLTRKDIRDLRALLLKLEKGMMDW